MKVILLLIKLKFILEYLKKDNENIELNKNKNPEQDGL